MNDDDLRRIKLHFQKYRDVYIVLGTGIALGWTLKGMRKPKIDETAIIDKWLASLVNDGYSIFALDNQQKRLWQECWAWAESEAKRTGMSVTQVANILAHEFVDSKVHIQAA